MKQHKLFKVSFKKIKIFLFSFSGGLRTFFFTRGERNASRPGWLAKLVQQLHLH